MMLEVTDYAATKFQSILAENEQAQDTLIRVSLRAGGCSGFSIDVDLNEGDPGKFDLTFESNCVTFVIDRKSAIYLDGMIVDWEGGIMGGFKFNPPAAAGGCGCGISFSFQPPGQGSKLPELKMS